MSLRACGNSQMMMGKHTYTQRLYHIDMVIDASAVERCLSTQILNKQHDDGVLQTDTTTTVPIASINTARGATCSESLTLTAVR